MKLSIENFAIAAQEGLVVDSPYRYATTGEHYLGTLAAFASTEDEQTTSDASVNSSASDQNQIQ